MEGLEIIFLKQFWLVTTHLPLNLRLSARVTSMGQSRKQQPQSQVCFSPGRKLNAEIGEDFKVLVTAVCSSS